MNCPDITVLMQWMDGELQPERMAEIKLHIDACPGCLGLIEAQKRMETTWREDWKDPEENAFYIMRSRLLFAVPWWKKQRAWFAVAALFSLYLGVKIFYLDDRGRPMAEIAAEEALVESSIGEELRMETQEVLVTAEQGSLTVSEMEEEEAAEPLEELQFNAAAHPNQDEREIQEADEIEDMSVGDVLSVVSGETSSSSDVTLEGYADVPDVISARDESEELLYYESSENSPTPEVAVAGTIAGGLSGSGGGSGGMSPGASGSVSRSVTENDAAGFDDQEQQDTAAYGEICLQTVATEPTVIVELESGEILLLIRENWEELFQLIDTITAGETVVLNVDSTGSVTGSPITDELVITVPGEEYLNCSITVNPD